jgi:F0F1-type ATP synthase epsilon subunit
MDPNHFMWWFSGNWSKSVTVLVNDVEELTNIELSEATKELEKATLAVENAETKKTGCFCRIESNSA